ncbi:MAG TPA: hypothetical protein DCW42_09080 [Bacteroidetes bacterium]|nr:hypothetical protein [Bacteroidota bacterium]
MCHKFYKKGTHIEEIEDVLKAILRQIKIPYPNNITDLVFLALENNPTYLKQYKTYANEDTHIANAMIGKFVKNYTGMKVIGTCKNPRSKLIKSYTKLGY